MPGKNKNPMLGWHPPAELSAWIRAVDDERDESRRDENREPTDADVEAGAAKVRRVGARVRLKRPPTGQVAGKLQPTARFRS